MDMVSNRKINENYSDLNVFSSKEISGLLTNAEQRGDLLSLVKSLALPRS